MIPLLLALVFIRFWCSEFWIVDSAFRLDIALSLSLFCCLIIEFLRLPDQIPLTLSHLMSSDWHCLSRLWALLSLCGPSWWTLGPLTCTKLKLCRASHLSPSHRSPCNVQSRTTILWASPARPGHRQCRVWSFEFQMASNFERNEA